MSSRPVEQVQLRVAPPVPRPRPLRLQCSTYRPFSSLQYSWLQNLIYDFKNLAATPVLRNLRQHDLEPSLPSSAGKG